MVTRNNLFFSHLRYQLRAPPPCAHQSASRWRDPPPCELTPPPSPRFHSPWPRVGGFLPRHPQHLDSHRFQLTMQPGAIIAKPAMAKRQGRGRDLKWLFRKNTVRRKLCIRTIIDSTNCNTLPNWGKPSTLSTPHGEEKRFVPRSNHGARVLFLRPNHHDA